MSDVNRVPVTFRYDGLNHDFIKLLAEIAHYAASKYGSAEQYANGRLDGEKGSINHIYEHLRQYQTGEPHDHFKDPIYHLAAIAYNAMIEALYLRRFGHKVSPLNLQPRNEIKPIEEDRRFMPAETKELCPNGYR